MMKKIIKVILPIIMLLVLNLRIYMVNNKAEKSISEKITKGDIAQIGDNYFETDDEMMNGYSVKVLDSEIVKADEYLEKFGHSIDEQMYSDLEYYYIVSVSIRNDDNQYVGEKGIDFGRWYLQGDDYILRVEDFAYSLCNTTVGGSLSISLRENSEMTFILPFYMFSGTHSFKKISANAPELVITDYPVKLTMEMS